MESSYLRDKNTIQMNMRDNQFGLSQCSILMRDSFSARDYTNSLKEKVSLKDTRHRIVSSLICALSARITCECT